MKQKTLLITTAALLLAIFASAALLYKRGQANESARLATIHSDHLVRDYSPTLGNTDASVIIVEFFDPACGTCQAFHEPVKHLLEEHPDKLKLVLRYTTFQVGSEHIVALLEAARLQNNFWPVLDVLMDTQEKWKPLHEAELELALKQVGGLGLDLDRLRRDMNDPEIARRLQQDQDDANRLKVDTTPEFYVNGKPLSGFGFSVLKQAVEAALHGS